MSWWNRQKINGKGINDQPACSRTEEKSSNRTTSSNRDKPEFIYKEKREEKKQTNQLAVVLGIVNLFGHLWCKQIGSEETFV